MKNIFTRWYIVKMHLCAGNWTFIDYGKHTTNEDQSTTSIITLTFLLPFSKKYLQLKKYFCWYIICLEKKISYRRFCFGSSYCYEWYCIITHKIETKMKIPKWSLRLTDETSMMRWHKLLYSNGNLCSFLNFRSLLKSVETVIVCEISSYIKFHK